MFETAEDVQQKLGSTVILKKGHPIYVKGVASGGSTPKKDLMILYHELPLDGGRTSNWQECSVWDKELDWRGVSSLLGYCNLDYDKVYHDAINLKRMPIRKSVQGLSYQNTKVPRVRGMYDLGFEDRSVDFQRVVISKACFVDMILGKYPTLYEAVEILRKNKTFVGVAFNKNFAVIQKTLGPFYLEYKGKEVAWADDPLHKWRLGNDFSHLKETLEYSQIAY